MRDWKVTFMKGANSDADGFDRLLRSLLLLDFDAEVVKGGIAYRLKNGSEVEIGYSMGEVRVRAWGPDGKSVLAVEQTHFEEGGFLAFRDWMVELDTEGTVTLL